jgi:hypothetical protein
MTTFTKKEIGPSVSEIYHELEERKLKTNYFIVIGGASLVLQNLIKDTEDVDIASAFKNGPNEFSAISEKLGCNFMFTNEGGKLPLGLKFHHGKIPYSVGYVGIYDCLVKPAFVYNSIDIDGVKIPVRPIELIKMDYKEYIKGGYGKIPKSKIDTLKERFSRM